MFILSVQYTLAPPPPQPLIEIRSPGEFQVSLLGAGWCLAEQIANSRLAATSRS